uniref:Uncharacterized protein n=1 Tax=Rhizophora mucronata TaxID=61149 RepID=A0A2P2Q2E8_RHIMU
MWGYGNWLPTAQF